MLVSLSKDFKNLFLLKNGIYQINHFNLDLILPFRLQINEKYPNLGDFDNYGVCDHFSQVLEQCPMIESSTDRYFIMSVTEINKDYQPDDGGWRWHKWGKYIGCQEITSEYLYDEPIIEKVYCYSIYEVTNYIESRFNNNNIFENNVMIEHK